MGDWLPVRPGRAPGAGVRSRPAPPARLPLLPNRSPATWPTDVRHVAALQRLAGNQATVQRFTEGIREGIRSVVLAGFGAARVAALDQAGHQRAAAALGKMLGYAALHGSKGPHGDDSGFHVRLLAAVNDIAAEVAAHKDFASLPDRLQAIVYAAEKLNMDKLAGAPSDANKTWMKTQAAEGIEGAANPRVKGSTGKFGENAWKCNKLVADAYLADAGGAIGKAKYPFYGDDETWSYQANDLAVTMSRGKPQLRPGKELKHFPYSELIHLAADGKSVVEIDEFDSAGKVVAKYVLSAGVFEKHVLDAKGGWQKTKETADPAELTPGRFARTGDLVSFHNKEKGSSGHTGLTIGHDLFISAMNATEGVGILSISLHMNADAWDHYDYVGFRSFKK